ncbi:MAG: hypothetical protein ACOC8F_03115 [Planctomycetota bacterium]
MPPRKPIRIGCPQHGKLVGGTYACDEKGCYAPLGADGEFLLAHVRCDQDGGRCMQTLCVLHRHNRRGPGSWYPDRVLAAPPSRSARTRRGAAARPDPEAGLF